MQRKTLRLHTLLSLVAVSALGCGGSDIVECGGLVTLNGKPLENAAVMFSPVDGRRPATGKTNQRGRFTLTTFTPGDGALPGEHTVTVTAIIPTPPKSTSQPTGGGQPEIILDEPASQPKIKWLAPEKYSHGQTSGLSATVEHGRDHFEFHLK